MKIRDVSEYLPITNRFTDRHKPRQIFWQQYETMRENQNSGIIQVLSYYGIGGIGKTALLRQLGRELAEVTIPPSFLYFDLGVTHEAREVLEGIRNKLSDEAHFSFPLFDLAVYTYARRVGKTAEIPEIKSLAMKSSFLSMVLEVSQIFPGVDMLAKVIAVADKGIAFARNLLHQYRREISEFDRIPEDMLYARLSYYFALDLKDNLKHHSQPFVIFFDTYEKMVNEISSIGEPLQNDLWLRGKDGLIQHVPNVLWVIAGREKLKWEHFHSAWQNSLHQVQLNSLSFEDTAEYLKAAGVTGDELLRPLYDLTHGTPLYLELCVERFHTLKEYGIPSIQDFGKDTYALIECFAKYMDDSKKDIVYLLSCLGSWCEELIIDIAGKILPNFSITSYEKVRDFSFVAESSTGLYSMHQTVAETLFASCPELIRQNTVRYALAYYLQKLKHSGLSGEHLSHDMRMAVRFSLLRYPNNTEYFSFYEKELSDLFLHLTASCRFSLVNDAFDPIYKRATTGEASPLTATALRMMSLFLMYKGNYAEGIPYAEKAYTLFADFLGEDKEETLEASLQLGWCLLRQGQYAMAKEQSRSALTSAKKNLGNTHPLTLKLENLFANTLSALGKYGEAYAIYEQVLANRANVLGETHPDTLATKINLSAALADLGRYEEALRHKKEVVEMRKRIRGETHLETLRAMNSLANTLGTVGRYKEARKLKTEVLKQQRELLGDNHPETIRAMHSLANSLHSTGQYAESLVLKKEVFAKRLQILGADHPDTIRAQHSLAALFSILGRHRKALAMQTEVFEKRKALLGEEHPDTVRARKSLANGLHHFGRHEEAMALYQEIPEKYAALFGRQHPETLEVLREMASCLYAMKKAHAALPYVEQLLAGLEEVSVNPYRRIEWLDTVSRIYAALGKSEEAKAFAIANLKEAKAEYGDNPDFMKARYQTMGYVFAKAGQPKKAAKYSRMAAKARK